MVVGLRGAVLGLVRIKNDGTWMTTKRRHLCFHEGMQRQRLQDLMKFARALDPENTDVGPLANDSPEMKPLALTLQLGRALVLKRAQALDLLGIHSERCPDGNGDMKQQDLTP
jgi:hypothetical protein